MDFTDVQVNTNTGTVETRAQLPNAGGGLKPGQFVRARLAGAVRPAAITVPQRSILEGPKGKFVYVVNRGQGRDAAGRGRRMGRRVVGDRFRCRTGRKVIVDGVMKIGPGAPVRIAAPGGDGKLPAPPPRGKGDKGAAKKSEETANRQTKRPRQ